MKNIKKGQIRIAYLSTFYPYRGGIAQFNASLFRALEKDYLTQAFTFKRQYPTKLFPGKTQFVTETDNADPIPASKIIDSINPISYLRTVKKIKQFSPDILLMKYWLWFFAPSLGWVASRMKKGNVKVITILDNVVSHEKKIFDKPLTKYFIRQNSGFVVMSDTVKNDLLSINPNANYIKLLHPLYNHFGDKIDKNEARQKLKIPKNKKVLLFLGLIREYKGLDLLIKALSRLTDDYYLIVAGEVYGNENIYRELIKKYNVEKRINLNFRYIPDDDIPIFFSAADVNILPYKSATQSGILSVAYHFELPVIVTDVGSLKELVEPYKIGLVIKKPDENLIAQGIRKFFEQKNIQNYKENIKVFKEKNTWEQFGRNLVEWTNTDWKK